MMSNLEELIEKVTEFSARQAGTLQKMIYTIDGDSLQVMASKDNKLLGPNEEARIQVHTIQEECFSQIGIFSREKGVNFSAQIVRQFAGEPGLTQTLRQLRSEDYKVDPDHPPVHIHSFYELTYVARGTFGYDLADSSVLLRAGDALLMDTATIHRDSFREGECVVFFLSISAGLFDQMMSGEFSGSACGWLTGNRTESSRHIVFRGQQNDAVMEETLAAATEECMNQRLGWQEVCTHLTRRVIAALGKGYTVERREITGSASGTDVFAQVERHIMANLATVTPATLAEELHFNQRYYNRLIRKRTGMTLTEYIQHKRIAAAKRLLVETEQPVTAVVAAVGYRNMEYFYRIFREATGMTPAEFREEAKKE